MPDVPLSSLPIQTTLPAGSSVLVCQPEATGFSPGFGRALTSALALAATGTTTTRTLADRFGWALTVYDFGAVGDGATDDTAAIQRAIDYSSSTGAMVRVPHALYACSTSLVIKKFVHLVGDAATSVDGGYAQFGSQIVFTGSGAAAISTPAGVANSYMLLQDMAFRAASGSNYTWVIKTTGLANSDLSRIAVANLATGTTNGGVYFANEISAGAPCWSNRIHDCQFSAVGGQAMVEELSDSSFFAVYCSGGNTGKGSVWAGLDNRYSNIMHDDCGAGSTLLTIKPLGGFAGACNSYSNIQFQSPYTPCGIALDIQPSASGVLPHNSVFANFNFNNLRSNIATIRCSATNVLLNNMVSTDQGSVGVLCTGSADYLDLIGGQFTGSVTLLGAHSSWMRGQSVKSGGGYDFTTAAGYGVSFNANLAGSIPSFNGQIGLGWNYTNGAGEFSHFNNYIGATQSFSGYQRQVDNSVSLVYQFNPDGSLLLGPYHQPVIPVIQVSGGASTTAIAASRAAFVKDTAGGGITLSYNDAGTIRSITDGYATLVSPSFTGSASLLLGNGASNNGKLFQITKDASPLDYVGTQTRASFVVQHRDNQVVANNGQAPGIVFQFNCSGDGYVVPASNLSTSINEGLLITQTKTGDGSAQNITLIGQLGAVGAVGYNELGGFQGTLTNIGSTHGNISGYELISADGNATTNYDTAIKNVIARVARYNAGSRINVAFMASSEGNKPVDAILTTNNSAFNQWKAGLDLTGAIFTTGVAIGVPNGANISWMNSSGVQQPIIGVSNTNVTFIRPASSAANTQLQDYAGNILLQVGTASLILGSSTTPPTVKNTLGLNTQDSSGTSVPMIKADASNNTIIRPSYSTGSVILQDFSGAPTLIANSSGVTATGPITANAFTATLHTPASSSEACTAGAFVDDANFHYVCVATNTWKRVALTAF